LKLAIVADPYDVSNYVQLAENCLKKNDFEAAKNILTRGIAMVGSHSALDGRLRRVQEHLTKREAEVERHHRQEILHRHEPKRVPWLEAGMLLAGIVLASQVFPAAGAAVVRGIDFRSWSRINWIYAISAVIIALFLVRESATGLFAKRLYVTGWVLPPLLFLQVIPAAKTATWRVIDIRQWTNGNWLVAVMTVLIILLVIRFGPEINAAWGIGSKRVRRTAHVRFKTGDQTNLS
jgi:hypothetical protein